MNKIKSKKSAPRNHKQYIVQFGSGKPGELGTEETERKVLERIGIKDPQIGFAPFHHLDEGQVNDWTLFKHLMQPLTSKTITLVEFHKEQDIEVLKKKILSCDIFVLGSGIVEPYLEFIFKNKLHLTFQKYFNQGKSFWGYSAGSISVCAQYIHVVFFREILLHWQAISRGLGQKELAEFKRQLLQEPALGNEELAQLLNSKEDLDPMKHPASKDVFHISKMGALGFLPHICMLPHYGEAIHAMDEHLQTAAVNFPRYHHYGIPNGVTLFHTFENQRLMDSEVVGKNLNQELKVTRFFPKDKKTFEEGDKIPLQ